MTAGVAASEPSEQGRRGGATPEAEVWRYPDMCRHWGVSRATIERWLRRYETSGVGIPVYRDPSGRPYWLPHEAAGEAAADAGGAKAQPGGPHSERLERLRRAAQRRRPGA